VNNGDLNGWYLGMPIDVGSSMKGMFKFLRDRVWSKVKGWLKKILLAGGKEILIKSIAQAIPIYLMACFRFPRGLCKHIDSLICQLWWEVNKGREMLAGWHGML
jgi:hypothetical protein